MNKMFLYISTNVLKIKKLKSTVCSNPLLRHSSVQMLALIIL